MEIGNLNNLFPCASQLTAMLTLHDIHQEYYAHFVLPPDTFIVKHFEGVMIAVRPFELATVYFSVMFTDHMT